MFQRQIQEIFNRDIVSGYRISERTIEFCLKNDRRSGPEITFDKLSQLSKLLRTTKINLGETTKTREDHGTYGISFYTQQKIICWDICYDYEE
jgi:hypothetical protein